MIRYWFKCGRQNHIEAHYLGGHFFVSHLSQEEMSMLVEMLKSNIKSKEILNHLKQRDEPNCNTFKII